MDPATLVGRRDDMQIVDVRYPRNPPDNRFDEHQCLRSEFMSLIFEVQDHFGDHVPTEEEIQGLLRDRMVSEGRTPEDADEVIARITGES